MATTTNCPAGADYASMAQGLLPPERVEQLLQHMESCAHCLQTVRNMQGQDTLVEFLRARKGMPELSPDGTVAGLMHKLRGLASLPAGSGNEATQPPADTSSAKVGQRLRVSCTGCQATLTVKPELAGKKVRCPRCKEQVPLHDLR